LSVAAKQACLALSDRLSSLCCLMSGRGQPNTGTRS
jgi:hypothetical protein